MYWKKFVYKGCAWLVLFGCLVLLSGCGQGDNSVAPTSGSTVDEVVDSNAVKTDEESAENANEKPADKDEEKDDSNEAPEALPEQIKVPVNTEAMEISYLSEDGIDPLRAVHRCVSDGENIYLAYNEQDIFVMPIGADKHSPGNINNPEGMNACNVAMDIQGRLHLLMAGQSYEEWFIWRLNEEYQVEEVIDISAYFETKHIPIWFLIDKEGTYYLQWNNERNGIVVDREGALKHKLTPQSLGIGWIYEAAVGRDGRISLLYCGEDDNLVIGELDVEKGTIKSESSTLSFSGDETFSAMSAGTDTNLLLFSPNSGVWAYDREQELLENRVPLTDLGLRKDMECWPLTFLQDGRLLMMGKAVNADAAETELQIKYIPAGR